MEGMPVAKVSESPDYYEVLQLSRNASALIVTKAYRLLAALYHPDNAETGNAEAFRLIVEAHGVLADPVRRAAYDRSRFGVPDESRARVELSADPRATEMLYRDERELRHHILLALYTARRSRPDQPAVPLMVLLELFGCTVDEAQFTLWYLRGKKFIETHDDGVAITVAGVDHVEALSEDRDGLSLSSTTHPRMLPSKQRRHEP
jgi:curved DNA-binding protein